jgi:hypothetical protein
VYNHTLSWVINKLDATLKTKKLRKNFITHFFDIDPNQIILTDIENYFLVRQEESSTLEFKSGDVEIIDLYKEVAAFLNTEGGLIIIGAPRESKETIGKRTINFCQGEITYSKFVSKDWLYQKIFSNIVPSPTEIFIKEITTEKGNVFILDIPQSLNPPHQSNSDGRYYIRIDNEAKPAPHGLIQALFDKRRKPKIFARLTRKPVDSNTDMVYASLHNDSNIPADKVSFIIDIFNIESTDDKHKFKEIIEEEIGRKLSYSDSINQVLASVITMGVDFEVTHILKKYLVVISYWSKDTDFDATFFVVDPINDNIESNNWMDEGVKLIDIVNRINK